MNGAAQWLRGHVVTDDNARYLSCLSQLLILLVAAWYVTRKILAGASSGHAILAGSNVPNG